MADPASSLGRPEPTAEELDRFASTIKASWELDDAPFAAGPAPTAADLAALNPKPENGLRAATVKLDAPPAAPAPAMAPPATAMPPVAPVAAAPSPGARPTHAVNGTMLMQRQPVPVQAQPAPAAKPAFVPIATPMQSSPSLNTGEFEVPKKRTGVWIALLLGVVALVGGGLFALKPSGEDTIKAAPVKPTVEAPRENPIPPPPPPEDIPPPKATASVAAKPAETAKPPEKPEPPPKPEPVAAAKPEPKPAARAEPRPAPRPQPAPRAERPPPPAPAPAKPKAGSGGIVRDVPF